MSFTHFPIATSYTTEEQHQNQEIVVGISHRIYSDFVLFVCVCCVCMFLCNFITRINVCNYHNQDTEMSDCHKDLPSALLLKLHLLFPPALSLNSGNY